MDLNTFVTSLYVFTDDVIRPHCAQERPAQSLTESEVVTLSILAQSPQFRSERDFYRFADQYLREFFPRLPHLSQFNRLVRKYAHLVVIVFRILAELLRRPTDLYEAIDGTAVPIRNVQRRGHSWLVGQAAKGRSGRVGWFYGFIALAAVTSTGVITGYGFAPGNEKDQTLATNFLAARIDQHPRLLCVGQGDGLPVLTDRGFNGQFLHEIWRDELNTVVITPPQSTHRRKWAAKAYRWNASHRQIVETIFGRLHHVFGLEHERPHTLGGFFARLAARMTMSNFCIALNRLLNLPDLQYAHLFNW